MTVFQGMRRDGQWWFRVFGYGLTWKNIKKHPLMFSERYGYRKGIALFRWRFNLLLRGDFKP